MSVKQRAYEYSATLKGEVHSVTVVLEIGKGQANDKQWLKGELQLWIDNDEGLYREFYGSRPSDKVLTATHKNVTIRKVEI